MRRFSFTLNSNWRFRLKSHTITMRLLHFNADIFTERDLIIQRFFRLFFFLLLRRTSFLNNIECYVTEIEFPVWRRRKKNGIKKKRKSICINASIHISRSHPHDDYHVHHSAKRLIDLNLKIYMFSLNAFKISLITATGCCEKQQKKTSREWGPWWRERKKEKNVYCKLKYWCRYNVCPFQ